MLGCGVRKSWDKIRPKNTYQKRRYSLRVFGIPIYRWERMRKVSSSQRKEIERVQGTI